jgi:hypothetical protein
MDKAYKVSKKKDDKWLTYGNIKLNQYGKYSLGMKNTPELKSLVNSSAEWLNFSLFEDDGAKKVAMQDGNTYEAAKSGGYDDSNSDIPF